MRYRIRFVSSLLTLSALLTAAGCTKTPEEGKRHVVQRPITQEATLGGREVSVEVQHPQEVPIGSSYDYTLNVKNNSSDNSLYGVVLKQDLPEGFKIESSEPEVSREEEGEARWNLGELEPGATKTIRVTAASDKEGSAHLCLGVDYTPAVCVATKFVRPELQLTKQAPQEASLCAPATVRYTVKNTGTGAAENVVIVDELKEGLSTSKGDKQVRIEVGNLAAGKSRDFEVQLMPHKAGEFATRATAKMGDKEVRSNEATINVRAPQLEVTLDGPDADYVNRPLTYRMHVTNNGNAVAPKANVSVTLPEGVRVMRLGEAHLATSRQASQDHAAAAKPAAIAATQPSEGVIQWQLGDLRPGQSASMRFTAQSGTGKDLEYQAVAGFQCPGAEKEQMTTTASTQTKIIAVPALLVFAADKEDPVQVDKEVVYTIGVRNQGDARDTNIKVVATLPDQLEFVEATGTSKATAEGQDITFEPVEELGAGHQATWQLRAKAKDEGDVLLHVKVTSDGFEKPIITEEPTKLVKLQ